MQTRSALRASALVLGLAATSFAQDAGGEKVELRIHMEKGQKVWLKQSMTMDQDIDMGAMQMSTQMEMNQVWSQACEAVDDAGVMSVRLKFAHIWGKIVNPMMGEMAFDSDKPDAGSDNPMLAAAMQGITALAGKEIEQKLSPKGKSSDVRLPDAAMDADASKSVRDMAKALESIAMLPEKPVGVGDSWEVATSVPAQGMVLNVKMKNTLKKIEADRVTIGVEGSVSVGVAEGADEGNPMAQMMKSMKITDSVVKGTTVVSRADGLPISADIDQDISMQMDMPPEAAAQGMTEMKMKMKQKQRISRTEAPVEKTATTPEKSPEAPAPGPGAGDK